MGELSVWHWAILLLVFGVPGIVVWRTWPTKGKRPIEAEPAGTVVESLIRPMRLRGRAYRAAYWRTVLVAYLGILGAALLFSFAGGFSERASGDAADVSVVIVGSLFIAGAIYALWVVLAVSVRRLHDRDRAGWWAVPFVIFPAILDAIGKAETGDSGTVDGVQIILSAAGLVLVIWGFIEMGCLPGTAGTNRFGANPLTSSADEKQLATFD